MSRYILNADQPLNVPATATAGTSKPVRRYGGRKTVQFEGTFGGGKSMQLQGSIDGSNWINIGSAVTAAGTIVTTDDAWEFLRVNVTVAGTGTVTATLGGHDVGSH